MPWLGDDPLGAREMPSVSRETFCAEQLAEDHITRRIRRSRFVEGRRPLSPAVGNSHAWFCSSELSDLNTGHRSSEMPSTLVCRLGSTNPEGLGWSCGDFRRDEPRVDERFLLGLAHAISTTRLHPVLAGVRIDGLLNGNRQSVGNSDLNLHVAGSRAESAGQRASARRLHRA